MNGSKAGQALPSAYRYIDILRFKIDAIADTACPLSPDKGCPAAREGIEHYVSPCGAVENCIRDELNRLNRWVKFG